MKSTPGPITTYETDSNEHGFVRYAIETVSPEVPGFSAAIRTKCIVEALFVASADAEFAGLVLAAEPPGTELAPALAARGIPFRRPGGASQATVTPFPIVGSADADEEAA